MARLITPSLLNSFAWYNNCPYSWKEKAIQDLSNYLNRVPFEPNEYFERGNKYEKQVKALCNGWKVEDPMPTIKEMAKLCKGGLWQQNTKVFIVIDNVEYIVCGRIDVLKKDEIIDIKTTSNYKGEDSYLSTSQHVLYLYANHEIGGTINKFRYLVSDFNEIHKVSFEVEDWDLLRVEAFKLLTDFLNFLKGNKSLQEAYLHKFCR